MCNIMKSSVKNGLALFSVLIAVSLGVAYAEQTELPTTAVMSCR